MRSYRKIHVGKARNFYPSPCHSTAENNVSRAASLDIISCMPSISLLLGSYSCAGLLLTPVIQLKQAAMEAG